jgi:hypothetical protein
MSRYPESSRRGRGNPPQSQSDDHRSPNRNNDTRTASQHQSDQQNVRDTVQGVPIGSQGYPSWVPHMANQGHVHFSQQQYTPGQLVATGTPGGTQGPGMVASNTAAEPANNNFPSAGLGAGGGNLPQHEGLNGPSGARDRSGRQQTASPDVMGSTVSDWVSKSDPAIC